MHNVYNSLEFLPDDLASDLMYSNLSLVLNNVKFLDTLTLKKEIIRNMKFSAYLPLSIVIIDKIPFNKLYIVDMGEVILEYRMDSDIYKILGEPINQF